jgi:hypothetical protein
LGGRGRAWQEKVLYHNNKRYYVKIPQKIDKEITLRLRWLGKTRFNKTGHLFLHICLNKGEDVKKSLWLSETSARYGKDKNLLLDGKRITMVIPPKSYNGLTIRLKGFGRESSFSQRAPVLHQKKRGNLLVKLFVYPDSITPKYGSFEYLSTENMALEGWVYRKSDEVIQKIGKPSFPEQAIQAGTIADLFNEHGWMGIFHALVDHLKLTHLKIWLTKSDSISVPGSCERTVALKNNRPIGYNYEVTINKQFLNNPFSMAAIMAHELCHVVYSERIDNKPISTGYKIKTDKATLEEERTVDLLVFMFRIGEFQLRVARDTRLTLGYFNQDVFERIQVIVSRKLNSF